MRGWETRGYDDSGPAKPRDWDYSDSRRDWDPHNRFVLSLLPFVSEVKS